MSDLKQMLKNKFDENRGLLKEVAIAAGLSNSTALSKWLDDPKKELSDFNVLVYIVKSLYPDREYELISSYSLSINPTNQAARQALEYADVNFLTELTDKLIIRLKESKNSTSKEWAEVYELHRRLATGQISVIEARDILCDITIKSVEMKLFSKIMFLYPYLNKRDFKSLKETLDYIDLNKINELSSTYLSGSFKCRILMIRANSNVVEANVEDVRENVNECLEITNTLRFIAFGYLNIGNSYIFENYDEAKRNFLKGLEAAGDNPIYRTQLLRSLSFLENYWGKENNYIDKYSDEIDDLQEVAFMHIRKGENDKALEILDAMKNNNDLTEYDLAYDNFYRGLITKDKNYFYDSIEYFILTGDKFFRKAPLIELKKLGESDRSLRLYSL
ncbi:AimR family lysis-lysogeny pheromone receptor [Metabacillus sp. Hm71]|uniref:AimR family lysis-lysogeny pheromone receptor n=1 Tax=Metabacillus sp. Hm71 TaxID=3450743 RepID=UPI003F42C0AE